MPNRLVLEGYVTKDGVRRIYTQSGKEIQWVTIACYEKPKKDGTKVVNYLSVKYWDTYISDQLRPGMRVLIYAHLSAWPVKNDAGQIIRTDMAIEGDVISTIVEKPKDEQAAPPAGTTSTPPEDTQGEPPDFNDEEIPFS
jgi:single-stranded DNA-binding protein